MRIALIAACVLALGAVACHPSTPWKDPVIGTDSCDACHAIIASPRFAAQLRRADGSIASFDDPSCLLRTLAATAQPSRSARFHTEGADGWVESGDVWFARIPGQPTPHGDGWVAFSAFATAQNAVASAGGGEILPYDRLRQRLAD